MSSWSTPIATPVGVEPLETVLQKSIDIKDKIRLVVASIKSKSRVFSDSSTIVESLPQLLLLLKESMWMHQDDYEFFSVLSLHSSISIVRLLAVAKEVKFIVPLTSFPSSIDWSRDENFNFFSVLNFNKKGVLIDFSAKTLSLDAIDYYFLLMAVLPVMTTATGPRSAVPGCVFDKLVCEIVQTAATGNVGAIPPLLAHKCDLTLSALIDFLANLDLFSFNNSIDFSHVFRLHASFAEICFQSPSPLCVSYMHRLGTLFKELFSDPNNWLAQKFISRTTPEILKEIVLCWAKLCRLQQHIFIYVELLTCVPVVEFAKDFSDAIEARKLDRFVALRATRDMIDVLLCLLGVAREFPQASMGPQALSVTRAAWNICRSCSSVKGMLEVESRMDRIVQESKSYLEKTNRDDERNHFFRIFTWDLSQEEKEVENHLVVIPKMKSISQSNHIKPQNHFSWDQPVSLSEIGPLVLWLRKLINWAFDSDSEKLNQFAWIRIFSSVSLVLVLTFAAWIWTSLMICPKIHSKPFLALIQFGFSLSVSVLSLKWINSQYIV